MKTCDNCRAKETCTKPKEVCAMWHEIEEDNRLAILEHIHKVESGCADKMRAENRRLREIEERAEDIMNKAHLAADHYAYDLMRTVLGETK